MAAAEESNPGAPGHAGVDRETAGTSDRALPDVLPPSVPARKPRADFYAGRQAAGGPL